MDWLNYHHLLYFWTVAKEGGLAPAGKKLMLSQSALSGQIHRLEEILGHALLEKRGRKLELTELGRVAYDYAEGIFSLGQELMNTFRARSNGRVPRVRIGIADVVPKLLVRTLLGPVIRNEEPWRLTCLEDRFDRLLERLGAHEIDVVIADSPLPPDTAIKAFNHLLGETTVSLVAPPNLARTMRRDFPASLQGAPLLLPLLGSPLRREIDHWLGRHGLEVDVIVEAEDSALLKAFASDQMGAIFVPTVVVETVCVRYALERVAEVTEIRERYYAISGERKIVHPAVAAIREQAREKLFG